MATGIDIKTLRQQTLDDLRDSRREITAETTRLRAEYSPQHLAQEAMRRHGPVVLAGAALAGVGVALLLSRRKAPPPPPPAYFRRPEPVPKRPGLIGSSLRALAEFALPTLLKRAAEGFAKGYESRQPWADGSDKPSPIP